jgi:hypothetical protein
MKKSLMRKAFTFFLLLFTVMTASAQNRLTINGKISDAETSEPLTGVSISVIN